MDEEHLEGPEIPISDVLNEENGWLSKGKLSVEYGIEVLVEKRGDDLWRFNLNGNYVFEKHIILTYPTQNLYAHGQMAEFHSLVFSREDGKLPVNRRKLRMKSVKNCFQIAHGVNLRISMAKAIDIISVAHDLKFNNVLEYCQREIIQRHLDVSHYDTFQDPYIAFILREHNFQKSKWFVFFLEFAMKLGLRHYLVHFLKNYDLQLLADRLKLVDLDSATGESRKIVVAMFFRNDFTRK
uniref:BTB domain-containing protein n=1 Tax=Caenorhabditis tropicalis TaxID=1561998 RepID=A0A1I7UE13_9PELO